MHYYVVCEGILCVLTLENVFMLSTVNYVSRKSAIKIKFGLI